MKGKVVIVPTINCECSGWGEWGSNSRSYLSPISQSCLSFSFPVSPACLSYSFSLSPSVSLCPSLSFMSVQLPYRSPASCLPCSLSLSMSGSHTLFFSPPVSFVSYSFPCLHRLLNCFPCVLSSPAFLLPGSSFSVVSLRFHIFIFFLSVPNNPLYYV